MDLRHLRYFVAVAPAALLAQAGSHIGETQMTINADRYQRGLEGLKQVGGADYDAPMGSLRDLAPDLARLTVEFAYGDVMARPALDLKARQLCTVAALAAADARGGQGAARRITAVAGRYQAGRRSGRSRAGRSLL